MSTRHTTFQEVMAGTVRLGGPDAGERPMRLELSVDLPEPLRPWGDTEGTMTGRVHVPGWADDPGATGTLRVAPLTARRIRYRMDFRAADGRALHLDGWKSVSLRRPLRSMTHLPATITDADGTVVGEARLRFDVRRDLAGFLAGFRLPRPDREPGNGSAAAALAGNGSTPQGGPGGGAAPPTRTASWTRALRPGRAVRTAGRADTADPADAADTAAGLFRSRWRGQPGRLEVWYTTLTDPATGTGLWLHHELVAPADGGEPRAHGWAALFPPGEPPALARFGPERWTASGGFASASATATVDRLRGAAGPLSWDLTASGGGAPLYTFPRWAWERELLPAAQIVPAPVAAYDGTVRCGDRVLELRGAPGGSARIYGHGNAERWAWLHADLGGGDVCEVVAAVSTRKVLDRLPPLPFVRLRVDGADWPAGDPLLHALRSSAELGLPSWTVRARSGDRAVRIEVTLPPGGTVAVDYADPDGRAAVCHNSERADAVITLLRRAGSRWETERTWRLDGTAHAEVGLR